MSDSIIALGRNKVFAHRNKKKPKQLYGRIDLTLKDLTKFIGKEVKIIICLEEECEQKQ